MGRFLKITLDDKARAELENSYQNGESHSFRQHCQMVLLKAEGRKTRDIAAIFRCCEKSVNDWLHRYKKDGINGLRIKPGRGRPSILSEKADQEAVRSAVTEHRQRISLAKAELEARLGKQFSERTLVRFLKNLTADINASGAESGEAKTR
jgi:transposase